MIVLGFDTATPATAVGLRLADGTTLRARDDPGAGERPGHTTRLLPLASELLAEAGLRWGAVELIAVGLGPGTFTGLRIGVATARGLAQSLDVEVVGVSTLRVLAEVALRAQPADVLAAIDARRGEAFVAAYRAQGALALTPPHELAGRELPLESSGRESPLGSSGCEPPFEPSGRELSLEPPGSEPDTRAMALELAAPRALAPADFGTVIAASQADHDWLAVGDGAIRFRTDLEALGVVVATELSPLHRVDAGVLCELGLDAARATISDRSPEAVLPDYRRRPDAEIALEKTQS